MPGIKEIIYDALRYFLGSLDHELRHIAQHIVGNDVAVGIFGIVVGKFADVAADKLIDEEDGCLLAPTVGSGTKFFDNVFEIGFTATTFQVVFNLRFRS